MAAGARAAQVPQVLEAIAGLGDRRPRQAGLPFVEAADPALDAVDRAPGDAGLAAPRAEAPPAQCPGGIALWRRLERDSRREARDRGGRDRGGGPGPAEWSRPVPVSLFVVGEAGREPRVAGAVDPASSARARIRVDHAASTKSTCARGKAATAVARRPGAGDRAHGDGGRGGGGAAPAAEGRLGGRRRRLDGADVAGAAGGRPRRRVTPEQPRPAHEGLKQLTGGKRAGRCRHAGRRGGIRPRTGLPSNGVRRSPEGRPRAGAAADPRP